MSATIYPSPEDRRVNEDTTFDVQMSLYTSSMIVQGEPVILNYIITNLSDRKVGWRPGRHNDEWYRLSLTDEVGQEVAPAAIFTPHVSRGVTAMPRPLLQPGEQRRGGIVVTQFFAFPVAGRYTLTARVQTPYIVEPTLESPRALENLLETTEDVFLRNYVFLLTVNPADPNQLTDSAEVLCEAILAEKDGAKKQVLVDALFAMPEAEALPSWEKLATVNRGWAARGLVRTGSLKAADLLAKMQWDPATQQSAPDHPSMLQFLAQMYETGDSKLRQHIRRLFEEHGSKVENVPGTID